MALAVGKETCCHPARPQRGTRELPCSEEAPLALQERPCLCLARGLVHPPSSKDFPKCVVSVSSALSDLKWQVKTCWASPRGHINRAACVHVEMHSRSWPWSDGAPGTQQMLLIHELVVCLLA